MRNRKKATLATVAAATLGLVMSGVAGLMLASPASAAGPTSPASPGGGTITVTNVDGSPLALDGSSNPIIRSGQQVKVSGSGFSNGIDLYVSYCGNPPGALNCNQIVGDYVAAYGTPTGGISLDGTDGGGDIILTIKNPIIKSASVSIDCTASVNNCAVGTSRASVPSDPNWNTVLPFNMPAPKLTAPSSGPAGVAISVSGSDFPVGDSYAKKSTAPFYTAVTPPGSLWLTQCAMTGTGPACTQSGPITSVPFPNNANGSWPAASFTPQRIINATPPGPPGPTVAYDCSTPGLCFIGTSNATTPSSRGYDALTPFTVDINPVFTITGVSTQSVTTAARSGNTVTVDGTDFTTGAVTAELCADAAGTTCDAAGTSNNTISAAGDGTVDVTGTATTGARYLVLTQGSKKASQAITILGAPTLAPSSSIAGPGDSVDFTGSNWNPGQSVTVDNGVGSVTANATGGLPAGLSWTAVGAPGDTITFNGSQAAGTSASTTVDIAGDNCTSKPVNTTCSLTQTLTLQITGGNLSMSKVPGTVPMSGITLNGAPQTSTGDIKTVTVTDARGGAAGWSLTGVLSDFGNGSGDSIPASDVTWTPDCAVINGNPVTTGGVAALDNTVAKDLCTIAASGGGQFTADAGLSVPVAPFQAPGNYTATLTLTLG